MTPAKKMARLAIALTAIFLFATASLPPGALSAQTRTPSDSPARFGSSTTTKEKSFVSAGGLGMGWGWGAPYSFALHGFVDLMEVFQIYGGLGINMSGGRYGLGLRGFIPLIPDSLDYHLGAAWAHNTGVAKIDFEASAFAEANYGFHPTELIVIRNGVRWKDGPAGIIVNIGWGFTTSDPGPFPVGNPDGNFEWTASIYKPGGIDVSFALYVEIW